MRIGDWSSDVCSSDLTPQPRILRRHHADEQRLMTLRIVDTRVGQLARGAGLAGNDITLNGGTRGAAAGLDDRLQHAPQLTRRMRSEERRVGTEGVSTCRSRWSQYP